MVEKIGAFTRHPQFIRTTAHKRGCTSCRRRQPLSIKYYTPSVLVNATFLLKQCPTPLLRRSRRTSHQQRPLLRLRGLSTPQLQCQRYTGPAPVAEYVTPSGSAKAEAVQDGGAGRSDERHHRAFPQSVHGWKLFECSLNDLTSDDARPHTLDGGASLSVLEHGRDCVTTLRCSTLQESGRRTSAHCRRSPTVSGISYTTTTQRSASPRCQSSRASEVQVL